MALLQISEPGQSPAPHLRKRAVGVDLGTTHSLVATVRSGTPVALPDVNGEMIMPSAVRYLAGGETVVGTVARAQAAEDPLNTLVSVKRFMGRGLQDVASLGGSLPYQFVSGDGMVCMQTVAGAISPVQASAEILKTLAARARAACFVRACARIVDCAHALSSLCASPRWVTNGSKASTTTDRRASFRPTLSSPVSASCCFVALLTVCRAEQTTPSLAKRRSPSLNMLRARIRKTICR